MVKINGKADVTQNRSNLKFTPFEGHEFGGRYEGPDAAVLAAYNQLLLLGYEVEYINDSSPISAVTFRFCGQVINGVIQNPNADYQDTWELTRNTVQKELLESDHPKVNLVLDTADQPNLTELKKYMNNPQLFIDENGFTLGASADSFDAANYLFQLFQSGVRTVPVKQPILRLTRTTNPLYSAPFATGNIDTLLTTASVQADAGLPVAFAIPLVALATQLMAKTQVDANGYQVRGDALKLKFGWLKELISSNKHGKKRIQYVLEYQFGLWDTGLYGQPV